MADLLQLAYSLPVVRISLSHLDDEPAVRIQLVINREGEREVSQDRVEPMTRFGFAKDIERSTRSSQLDVPLPLAEWIGAWLHERLVRHAGGDTPPALWIHLVKPYGMLGGVPWERRLQPACRIPVVRLPDVLPPAERPATTYDVALCATVPNEYGGSSVVRMLPHVASEIARGVGERLRLHVFTDTAASDLVLEELNQRLAGNVVVHRVPRGLDSYNAHTAPAFESAWLRWIREAMAGRVLDAVHFIAHGCALGTDGALLTSLSPTHDGRVFPYALQAAQLRAFLTAVGAVTAGFSAPPDNTSPYGLLRLVDDLGSLKAGPVLLDDAGSTPNRDVLARTYRLVSAGEPDEAPADPALVLFVQPRRIKGLEPTAGGLVDHVAPPTPAIEQHLERADTPLWVAASQQYLREREAELVRFRKSAREQPPTPAQTAYYAGVEKALPRIRSVLDKHAEASL
jgi:hypothetical protein